MPVSVFQTLFAMVNPMQASLKLQKLARLDPDGTAARLFVALEDWLAEGVPMPAGAARDLLVGWQVRNLTATGGWRFLGGVVDPGAIDGAGARRLGHARRDRAAAARRAARPGDPARPHARPQTGHVGMVVGSLARPQVWRPIAGFLAGLPERGETPSG